MYAFTKSVRKADHVRRYTIEPADEGWEVRTESDTEPVHRVRYSDWHRVEHARRAITRELAALVENGWMEVPA